LQTIPKKTGEIKKATKTQWDCNVNKVERERGGNFCKFKERERERVSE